MKKKSINFSSFIYYIVLVLFCLTCISMYISFDFLSRYTDYKDGSDSVNLANFVINIVPDHSQDLNIDTTNNENSVDYTFSISNNKNGIITEVATDYDIVVQSPEDLPEGISININGVSPIKDGNKYIFSNAGSFSSGVAGTNTHVITFVADTDIITDNININDISINVIAKQTD